ncbi:MAG: hypothetical protein WC651_04790, partial [Candidatus Gracilibacteria bacterium]
MVEPGLFYKIIIMAMGEKRVEERYSAPTEVVAVIERPDFVVAEIARLVKSGVLSVQVALEVLTPFAKARDTLVAELEKLITEKSGGTKEVK